MTKYTYSDDLISDLHKDARGFRPTEAFWNAWNFQDDEGKQTTWNILIDEMEQSLAQQKASEAAALVKFRKQIASTMKFCDCNWKTALRYLVDAENLDVNFELDYFLWNQGIGYTDRNKIDKLFKEVV